MEVIQGREKALGANHPDTLEAKNGYTLALMEQMKFEEAAKVQIEVILKREELLVERNILTL